MLANTWSTTGVRYVTVGIRRNEGWWHIKTVTVWLKEVIRTGKFKVTECVAPPSAKRERKRKMRAVFQLRNEKCYVDSEVGRETCLR